MPRRQPGELVKRRAGSGFVASGEPELLIIPEGEEYDNAMGCCVCDDESCVEYANLEIANGSYKGQYMFHVSECQMEDPTESISS